jgi:hypothetical protein
MSLFEFELLTYALILLFVLVNLCFKIVQLIFFLLIKIVKVIESVEDDIHIFLLYL